MDAPTLHELLLHERACYEQVVQASKGGSGPGTKEQLQRAILRWETVNALVVQAMEQTVETKAGNA